ncbi:MAG: hypothetical protein PHU63_02475 [Candidatus ainarchaeum sp.]|nr:hypothetical protein [Candidatus ainarchaeum sp.]
MKSKFFAMILFVFLLSIFLFFYFDSQDIKSQNQTQAVFHPLELSFAGNYGYVIYNSTGKSSATLLSLNSRPITHIYILESSFGLGINSLPDFISEIKSLEEYGFTVDTVSSMIPVKQHSLLIVPQGGMPELVLDFMHENLTVLLIGKTDVFIGDEINHDNWYSSLENSKKSKIILYNETLDELYLQNKVPSIKQEILTNSWFIEEEKTFYFNKGKGTVTILRHNANYLRLIYPSDKGYKILDSSEANSSIKTINIKSAFPGQKKSFEFSVTDSKGVPRLVISKDGKVVSEEKLGSIQQNVFYNSLSFSSPGDYILKILDYEGELASGVFHVYDLNISFVHTDGFLYTFLVYLDGEPLQSEQVKVTIPDSGNSGEFFVSNGQLIIPAKLKKGENTIILTIQGTDFPVNVEYSGQGIFDIYFAYGPAGLFLIIIIYLVVTLTRKKPYVITFDSPGKLSSNELKLKKSNVKNIIEKSISEFGINNCITPREFSLALKKYLTNGYDVLDGNSEALLKSFEKEGYLSSYNSIYSLRTDNIKKIVIDRLVREKLIEHGITFVYSKGVFKTKDLLLSYEKIPEKSSTKTIVVFDKKSEISSYLDSLNQKQKARTALKIRNGSLLLLDLEELDEYL